MALACRNLPYAQALPHLVRCRQCPSTEGVQVKGIAADGRLSHTPSTQPPTTNRAPTPLTSWEPRSWSSAARASTRSRCGSCRRSDCGWRRVVGSGIGQGMGEGARSRPVCVLLDDSKGWTSTGSQGKDEGISQHKSISAQKKEKTTTKQTKSRSSTEFLGIGCDHTCSTDECDEWMMAHSHLFSSDASNWLIHPPHSKHALFQATHPLC